MRPDAPKTPLQTPSPHESGRRHVTGEAIYIDDMPAPKGMLVGHIVTSPHAHARLLRLDVSAAAASPGVAAVFTAADIPGENSIGAIAHDEPLLAAGEVHCVGQAVAFIVADSLASCRAAASLVQADYEPLPALLTLQEAVAAQSFLSTPHVIARGDVDAGLQAAALRLSGEVSNGWQDHFYLETHVALALPEEADTFKIYSSTQHPSEVQAKVGEVLGIPRHQIVVEVPRMGGGFGGKETQAAQFAAMAALAARRTQKPVKVWLNRDQDMQQTGKRHPFWSKYDAGFDADGRITSLRVEMYADGGWALDLSRSILDRGLFHLDNSYFIPALRFEGRVARTNTTSNTAFRGFGGPQGVLVIEELMERAAAHLNLDPVEVRARNYYGDAPRDLTPYGQAVTHCRLARIHAELMDSSHYTARRAQIDAFNARSPWIKRGIGYTPVKFGISFTASFLNQAGALALIYSDGSVQLNHGGTEMGQGLHTKMIAVCAHELGVPMHQVRLMTTATDKVPNTSATAASSGSDLNGQAVKAACEVLRERLRPVAAQVLGVPPADAPQIAFADGQVYIAGRDGCSTTFAKVVFAAYMSQISLSATGYYKTPDIHYDAAKGRGKPFHYFAYGGAVSEVEVNGLTGEYRLQRVDILHDVGDALVPSVDIGQVEGAFIQGVGWLTTEELVWDAQGRLKTYSPDTYKIPAVGDAPEDFRVALLERAPQPDVIHGSKAVGEPPFMLGISAICALRHAVNAFASKDATTHPDISIAIPCTPEAVLRAVEAAKRLQPTATPEATYAEAAASVAPSP
jgi:xanthine dehydrogenase large subunit